MTARSALLIANAHLLDLVTLLAVLPLYSMEGEYGLGFGAIYPVAGTMGVICLKTAGIGLMVAFVGHPKLSQRRLLALSLAVCAGLMGAAVNALAYTVIR